MSGSDSVERGDVQPAAPSTLGGLQREPESSGAPVRGSKQELSTGNETHQFAGCLLLASRRESVMPVLPTYAASASIRASLGSLNSTVLKAGGSHSPSSPSIPPPTSALSLLPCEHAAEPAGGKWGDEQGGSNEVAPTSAAAACSGVKPPSFVERAECAALPPVGGSPDGWPRFPVTLAMRGATLFVRATGSEDGAR